jgi:membrane protein implicated in regulation of membrane protease activity
MTPRLIFGREPALWLNFIAVVVYAVGLTLGLSTDAQGILNAIAALLAGLIIAGFVKAEEWVPILLGMFKLVIALVISLGVDLSPEVQVMVMSALTAFLALATRTQVVAPVAPKAAGAQVRSAA